MPLHMEHQQYPHRSPIKNALDLLKRSLHRILVVIFSDYFYNGVMVKIITQGD